MLASLASKKTPSVSLGISSIDDVLAYKNEDVVFRFAEDHGVSASDAEEIFLETKRWLWFCAKRTREVNSGKSAFLLIPLFNEANAIDLMWHTFILFTRDYAEFCEKYFGFFIHHSPKTKTERLEWQSRIHSDPEGAKREREAHLRQVYECVYEELGAEILVKWCEEFPVRFKLN